jgi:hypothetical protein
LSKSNAPPIVLANIQPEAFSGLMASSTTRRGSIIGTAQGSSSSSWVLVSSLQVSPPDGTSDVKNVPIVVFPPLPSNLALAQTSKCRYANYRPHDTLSNFGSVRTVIGGDDNRSCAGEKFKMLLHLLKSIGKALTPMFFSL